MRRISLLIVALALAPALTAQPALDAPARTGTVATSGAAHGVSEIERLRIGWGVAAEPERARMTLGVEWRPAAGEQATMIDALTMEVGVFSIDGARDDAPRMATLTLRLDSLALHPEPDLVTVDYAAPWASLVDGVEADSARAWFARGVRLDSLVLRAVHFLEPRPAALARGRVVRVPHAGPDVHIGIGWSGPHRPPPPRIRGERAPRENAGRTPARGERERDPDRGSREATDTAENAADGADREEGDERKKRRRGLSGLGDVLGGDDEDDDDDDDGPSLAPAAMGVGAAVGLVAVVGGTVGLSGTSEAPIGLAAGYARPRGGVVLRASVNAAVLHDGADQRLSAAAIGFRTVGRAPLQPALGVGVRMDNRGGVDARGALLVGAALNRGPVVSLVTVDVLSGHVGLSLAVNLHALR